MYNFRSEWEEFWKTATVSTPSLASYWQNTPLYDPYKNLFASLGQQPKLDQQLAYYTTKRSPSDAFKSTLQQNAFKSKVQSKVNPINAKKSNKSNVPPYYNGVAGDLGTAVTQYQYNDLYGYTKSYQPGEYNL